jgi:endopolyphosphatase
VFGKPDNFDDDDPTNDFVIPIIPTFGNNDILPHNIFMQGPNEWTQKYLQIWQQFIPEAQRHQFVRGGWFYVEVIPNQLAVFSLNTLYFFTSNSAVDGCARKSEPGFEQLEWLRIQLELLRQRGMKAILTGHVPPARVDAKTSWDETCWQKYTLWLKKYRDVIVASVYGHMNIDHFMVQDFKDIKNHVKKGLAVIEVSDNKWEDEMTISAAADYLVGLRSEFAKIPPIVSPFSTEDSHVNDQTDQQMVLLDVQPNKKKDKDVEDLLKDIGGQYAERYSISLIGASIVPNYFPSLRVVEYNISGLESITLPDYRLPRGDIDEAAEIMRSKKNKKGDDEKKKKKKKTRRYKFTVPKGPSKSAPPGPAYSPQTLTLTGYTNFYANLTYINNDFPRTPAHVEDDSLVEDKGWNAGKHKGKAMPSKPKPKEFKFEVEYDTNGDEIYKMKDLTVKNWLKLARRIAGEKKERKADEIDLEMKFKKKEKKGKGRERNEVWYTFIKRAFVSAKDRQEIEEEFGVYMGLDGNIWDENEHNMEL